MGKVFYTVYKCYGEVSGMTQRARKSFMFKQQTNLMKIVSKILHIIVLILFIWAFLALAFSGKFSFIPEAEYHFQEPYVVEETKGIDYIITVDFKSNGAFIAGKPINVEVEVSKLIGKKFVEGENFIIIGSSGSAYEYPLRKIEHGLYKGSIIYLRVMGDGEKLIGSKSIFFSSPGEYPIYSTLVFFNEDVQIGIQTENKIPISSSEAWLTIEQNNRIFSLTLVIVALALISLLNLRKNGK